MTDSYIMKLHSVIYNQLSAEAYRQMHCYARQNDIGEPVDNFTGVTDMAFSIHIAFSISLKVLTCMYS